MSIHIMNAVWQHGPQDRNGRMLLLAIADNANERGEAFPSLAVLGQKACMSKSVVIRTLQRLDAEGWLSVRKRAAAPEEYGRARGNLYVVALAKLRLSSYGSRGVSSTPRQKVASATAADCESSAADKARGVNPTPRQDSERDEVSKTADEVSKTAPRGVKSGVALIVEPSEPSLEPPPLPPSAEGGEAEIEQEFSKLQARRRELEALKLDAKRNGQWERVLAIGREQSATQGEMTRCLARRDELRKRHAPPEDAVHDPPPETRQRRRRRWTPAMVGMSASKG
jgi:hypothetical protein